VDNSATPQELVNELDVPRRFEIARNWALGARDVAEKTRHPLALRLWEFIDNRTTIGAPMPGGGIHYFFPEKPEHEYGYYAYLTPVLAEDADRLEPDDFRVGFATGNSSNIAEYREKSQAIYLPNSNFGAYGKGVLLLHEALHAWLDIKQRINRTKKNSHWIEEVRVFKFEFELLENLIGSGYIKLCKRMAKSIAPLPEDPEALNLDYRPTEEDEALIRDKMGTANDSETKIWVGVCKIHAYWLYFADTDSSADAELASFLKERSTPVL
jgi:hypothetical protein